MKLMLLSKSKWKIFEKKISTNALNTGSKEWKTQKNHSDSQIR